MVLHEIIMKLVGEFAGTFILVFFGCGSIIFMGNEIGLLGVALTFGLTLMVIIYAFGKKSGGHFNPAVSFGMLLAGRLSFNDFLLYIIIQILGAIVASGLLYVIILGQKTGYSINIQGFAQTGWSVYSSMSAFIYELVATFFFTVVILKITDESKTDRVSFGGILIGLTLAVIHLTGIDISGASVNPARSIGPALIAGGEAVSQLWLYIIAPLLGAGIAGLLCRKFSKY